MTPQPYPTPAATIATLPAVSAHALQLIRTLVRSLDGVIEAGSDGGAWFAVTFPAKPAHG